MTQKVMITPFDDLKGSTAIDQGFLSELGGALSEALGLEAPVDGYLPLPRAAYDDRRVQYRGDGFLDTLAAHKNGGAPDILLGLTGVDIFLPRLNFVFGVADRERAVAVVSVRRLYPEFYGADPDDALFRKRVLKEAVHELGHVLGLIHCDEPGCIMHFSNAIGDTDIKGPGFCEECLAELA